MADHTDALMVGRAGCVFMYIAGVGAGGYRDGWCVDVGLDDEGLEENREQRRKRESLPLPRRGAPKVSAASACPEHVNVILYHSRLMQTLVKSAASAFDKKRRKPAE